MPSPADQRDHLHWRGWQACLHWRSSSANPSADGQSAFTPRAQLALRSTNPCLRRASAPGWTGPCPDSGGSPRARVSRHLGAQGHSVPGGRSNGRSAQAVLHLGSCSGQARRRDGYPLGPSACQQAITPCPMISICSPCASGHAGTPEEPPGTKIRSSPGPCVLGWPGTNRVQITSPHTDQCLPTPPNVSAAHRPP